MAKEIKYEIIKKIGTLDSDSKYQKELRLISWNGAAGKYDIRGWKENEDGTESMSKGITLDEEELRSLYDILDEMFGGEENENN